MPLVISCAIKGNIKNLGIVAIEVAIISMIVGRSPTQMMLFIVGGIAGKTLTKVMFEK